MSAKFTWRFDSEEIVGHLEGVVKKRKLQVTKQLFDGIVMRTPVLSGSARASWRVSVGRPDLGRTINEAQSFVLGPPSFPLAEIPLYTKVFISNTTPYIVLLEYGWSKQAPAGMVRVTLASLGILENVRI
jgi:hypothetical protein